MQPATLTLITILGRGIRANLHRGAGDPLEPVISIRQGDTIAYGLTADLLGPAEILYAARPEEQPICGAEVYIRTLAEVLLYPHLIPPPRGRMPHVHTNTHHARANRRALERGATMPFKPVLAARPGKSARTQLCLQIATHGPAQLIYAAPYSGIAPMPCGAYVWLVCRSGVDVVPASAQEDAGVLLPTASAISAL